MEIGSYLRARPRLSALALLFPVLAAALAFLVLQGRPANYTATGTVSVPGSAADSASRVGIFVADFAEVASSDPVVREVSGRTHDAPADIQGGLAVTRIGQSSLFDVAYTGQHRASVEPVVRQVVASTFSRLTEVNSRDAAVAAATARYQAALNARSVYQDQIGTVQPDRDYADLSSRIRSLQVTPVYGSARTVAQLTAQRAVLVPQIRRMQELDQAVLDTATQRENAASAAAAARQDAVATQGPKVVRDLSVVEVSRVSRLVQGVGIAAVAGLLCGLAVLMLPDVLRRRPAGAAPRPVQPGTRESALPESAPVG